MHHYPVMAVTLICGFPLWWDLQRGSRAVDGWDWEASCACREEEKEANRGGREEEKKPQACTRFAPLGTLEYNGHDQATLSSRLFHSIRSGSLATAGAEAVTTVWTGWAGDMDRQLALNRLDVMHRRPLDSYPQRPRSRSGLDSLPVPII